MVTRSWLNLSLFILFWDLTRNAVLPFLGRGPDPLVDRSKGDQGARDPPRGGVPPPGGAPGAPRGPSKKCIFRCNFGKPPNGRKRDFCPPPDPKKILVQDHKRFFLQAMPPIREKGLAKTLKTATTSFLLFLVGAGGRGPGWFFTLGPIREGFTTVIVRGSKPPLKKSEYMHFGGIFVYLNKFYN